MRIWLKKLITIASNYKFPDVGSLDVPYSVIESYERRSNEIATYNILNKVSNYQKSLKSF
jgi:hypothetical protein